MLILDKIKSWKERYTSFKKRWFGEGLLAELISFVIALVIAFLFLQFLGLVLNTESPLVVIESESMIHGDTWNNKLLWYNENNLSVEKYPFSGGMGIGDVALIVGERPEDIEIGDIIVYTDPINPHPIIHRVVGIINVDGDSVTTDGAVGYDGQNVMINCNKKLYYDFEVLENQYSSLLYNSKKLHMDGYRMFVTKGDNNDFADQCSVRFFPPIHSDLVVGTAKFGIPIVGYVKLGFICGINYLTGNVCQTRCWWNADNQRCKAL